MAEVQRPINLAAALARFEAVLHVAGGLPGAQPRAMGVPWTFPEVGAAGNVLPGGSLGQNSRALFKYEIVSIVGLGNDEIREEYDPELAIPGDTYQPNPAAPAERLGAKILSTMGNRVITIQVRCEVHAADPAGPHTYLERVRTRLFLPSSTDALEEVGLGVADVRDTRPGPDSRDDSGRTVSSAYFEVELNAWDCASDDPVTTIEQIAFDPNPEIS